MGCVSDNMGCVSDNINAQSFYKSFGAKHDARWQGFVLEV